MVQKGHIKNLEGSLFIRGDSLFLEGVFPVYAEVIPPDN